MTERLDKAAPYWRAAALVALGLMVGAVLGLTGCAKQTASQQPQPDARKGYGMGGVEQTITISRTALNNYPAKWDLKTPTHAVQSYLDWISYAYRTSESDIASQTMTPSQFVRVDAYNQMNMQQKRLIDQKLESFTPGKLVIKGDRATLPAQEKWSYSYISITEADKVIEGPFSASYDTTYTLIKGKAGWQVDSIKVTPLGSIK